MSLGSRFPQAVDEPGTAPTSECIERPVLASAGKND
jgi:hypothetical protein